MALKKEDICTNIANEEDRDILTRPLFAVNMRLFNTSPGYRELVLAACKYIAECCGHESNGEPSYIGYSGANAGIPWDIIAIRRDGRVEVLINTSLQLGKVLAPSLESCGSLPPGNLFTVQRARTIDIAYYTPNGDFILQPGVGWEHGAGACIQHEVDHNDGILLTDRV